MTKELFNIRKDRQKNRGYEKVTITASGGKEVTTVTQEEAVENSDENANPQDDYAKGNQRNCEIATKNLDVLTKLARIQVSDEKGENRILTVEEKKAREDKTRKEIEIYCKTPPKL